MRKAETDVWNFPADGKVSYIMSGSNCVQAGKDPDADSEVERNSKNGFIYRLGK